MTARCCSFHETYPSRSAEPCADLPQAKKLGDAPFLSPQMMRALGAELDRAQGRVAQGTEGPPAPPTIQSAATAKTAELAAAEARAELAAALQQELAKLPSGTWERIETLADALDQGYAATRTALEGLQRSGCVVREPVAGGWQLTEKGRAAQGQPSARALAQRALEEALSSPSLTGQLSTANIAKARVAFAQLGALLEHEDLRHGLQVAGLEDAQRVAERERDQARAELERVKATLVSAAGAAPSATPQPVDFEAAFDAAFTRLNHQAGDINMVSLVELRKAVPVPRETFDAALKTLRRARKYSLQPYEGRFGITPEQTAAAIPEEGTHLLHVSRRPAS